MMMNPNNLNIISGGQSGVDRAALDFAMQHKIPCGGWCPAGWQKMVSSPIITPLEKLHHQIIVNVQE